ncbi:MAG TPA: aminopeptidase [Gemmatimonadaceae bacterium]|nr:aminopeptidase [Gemmatimonadaceae bacterium]
MRQHFTWRRTAGRLLGLAALVVLLYLVLAPTGRYLVRAAWEEGKILAGRRSIAALVEDPGTPPEVRAKLRLVLAARAFARDSIDLRTRQSFTTYTRLQHDTLVLVLSAAYRDRLESYTWWFPVVGRVPYKGYFDFRAARAAARQLEAHGYDVYLRPSAAFSTLGWFNDPLVSTTLRADSLDLANTVIHELTHNTFYAPGQAVFNESFANFVGARGSAWFFRARHERDAADEEDARWEDDKLMARFWERLRRSIDSAYAVYPGEGSAHVKMRISARDTVYARARLELVYGLGPRLRTIGPRVLERMRLDNATLLARRIYLTDLDLFDGVWTRQGGDLRKTTACIIELARSRPKDPYGALRQWLARTPAPEAQLPPNRPLNSARMSMAGTGGASGAAAGAGSSPNTNRCILARTPLSTNRVSWSIE